VAVESLKVLKDQSQEGNGVVTVRMKACEAFPYRSVAPDTSRHDFQMRHGVSLHQTRVQCKGSDAWGTSPGVAQATAGIGILALRWWHYFLSALERLESKKTL
jgi:hypothetical protein